MSLSLSALFVSLLLAGCDKESVMPVDEMPSEIQTYVSTHFPDNKVLQVIEDQDGFTKSYEVALDGSISLEFNRDKEIIDIDGVSALPNSVIPEKISTYVTDNYADNVIISWELDDRNQQVELDNGIELEFTMDGDFLRIDND